MPTHEIHIEFDRFLATIAPKQEIFQTLEQGILRDAAERAASSGAQRHRILAGLKDIEKQSDRLIHMRTADLITDDEFRVQKTVLWGRRTALQNQVVDDPLNPQELRAALTEICQPLTALPATWHALTAAYRPRFVQFVLPVGFVHRQIRTADLGLLFRVLGTSKDEGSNGVRPTWESSNRIWQEIQAFLEFLKDWREGQEASLEPVRIIPNE